MRHLEIAAESGVAHQVVELVAEPGTKNWYYLDGDNATSVEEAVLKCYIEKGWRGCSGEGALILNLIKAASFANISVRHRKIFTEALYAANVSFLEDKFETDFLLDNVRNATLAQVKRNWTVMTDRRTHLTKCTLLPYTFHGVDVGGRSAEMPSSGCMLDFFPNLKESDFVELFEALSPERLFQIAQRFSSAPYEYRKGWPDLTLWRNSDVEFVEVKAPGDKLRTSQKRIIFDILKPLEFKITIAEVVVRERV